MTHSTILKIREEFVYYNNCASFELDNDLECSTKKYLKGQKENVLEIIVYLG